MIGLDWNGPEADLGLPIRMDLAAEPTDLSGAWLAGAWLAGAWLSGARLPRI